LENKLGTPSTISATIESLSDKLAQTLDQDPSKLADVVADVSLRLRGIAEAMEPGWQKAHIMRADAGRQTWSAHGLLCVGLLGLYLKSGRDAERVVTMCSEILCPSMQLAKTFVDIARHPGGRLVPHLGIQMWALQLLDIAYCLTYREWLQKMGAKIYTYWLADSSKRRSFDWFNSAYWLVEMQRAFDAFEHVRYLTNNPNGDEAGRRLEDLFESVRYHAQVPQVMGHGFKEMDDLLAALQNAAFLDCGSREVLEDLMLGAISYTTDMGTEVGFSQYRKKATQCLLHWLQYQGGFESDIDERVSRPRDAPEGPPPDDAEGFENDIEIHPPQARIPVAPAGGVPLIESKEEAHFEPDIDDHGEFADLPDLVNDQEFEADVMGESRPVFEEDIAATSTQSLGPVEQEGGACSSNFSAEPAEPEPEPGSLGFPSGAAEDYFSPYAISVLGIMHVFHNGLRDGMRCLKQSAAFYIPMIIALSALFCHKDRVEVFLQVCIENTIYASYRYLFELLAPSFIDWRWGSVIDIALWLRVRRGVIIGAWKVAAMKKAFVKKRRGAAAAASAGEEAPEASEIFKTDITLVDVAVYSAKFWFYNDMILELGGVPSHMVVWLNDCICHQTTSESRAVSSHDDTTHVSFKSQRIASQLMNKQLPKGSKWRNRPCVMRGKWAPEIAAGKWRIVVRKAGSEARARLLGKAEAYGKRSDSSDTRNPDALLVLGRLKSEHVDEVLAEFDTGLEHVIVVYELKLEYTMEFPFVLNSLAVVDEGEAICHAKRLMRKFDQLLGAASGSVSGFDRVTIFFMWDGFKEATHIMTDYR